MAKAATLVICENARMAREFALQGSYDTAHVYYQNVLESLKNHIHGITDQLRKQKWVMVIVYFIFVITNYYLLFFVYRYNNK